MTIDQPSAGQQPGDHMAVFRKPPTGLLGFLGLIAVAGIATAITFAARSPVAKCGSRLMTPGGEICELRSGRRVRRTSEWTYDERLEFNAVENLSLVAAGIVIAVIAVLMIVAALLRWRRDIAVADLLAGEQAPLTAYARSTGVITGFGALVACVGGGVGVLLMVRVAAGRGSPVLGIILGALFVVAGLIVLWPSRPRGGNLVWAYPSVVRMVTRSKIHDVAWRDMQYAVAFEPPLAASLTWSGHKDRLSIDDEAFFATMRQRINTVLREQLPARWAAGETLDFGKVQVAGSTVTVKGKAVAGPDLAAVRAEKGKDGSLLRFLDRSGSEAASVNVLDVCNVDVLMELLAREFGTGMVRSGPPARST